MNDLRMNAENTQISWVKVAFGTGVHPLLRKTYFVFTCTGLAKSKKRSKFQTDGAAMDVA